MTGKTFTRIQEWLDRERVEYRHLNHEPTPTSEDAARVRGESLEIGGKAILLKISGDAFPSGFGLFVMSAAKKLDSSTIKKHFGVRKLRFATRDELFEQTGLVPGAVPPFGDPLFDYPLFVDLSISDNERIAFNAGSLQDSIIMSVTDYMRLSQPTILSFTHR